MGNVRNGDDGESLSKNPEEQLNSKSSRQAASVKFNARKSRGGVCVNVANGNGSTRS